MPSLIFIAGPNGAGKSTFYRTQLAASGLDFLNADELTRQFNVPAAEAARFLDGARAAYVAEGKSFITETVFSDAMGHKLRFLREAIAAGSDVHLIYIGLDSAMLSDARVCTRVSEGGHDVPPDRIPRRYAQSLVNLKEARCFVPNVTIYDNSGERNQFRCVYRKTNSKEAISFVERRPAWLKPVLD